MPKLSKITRKQAKFTKNIIRQIEANGDYNASKAVLESYNTTDKKSATVIASRNMDNPNIRDAILQALDKAGLSPDVLVDELKTLAVHEVDQVSGDTKLKTIIELLKLSGAYPGSKHTNINVKVTGKIKGLEFNDAKQALEDMRQQNDSIVSEVG